MRIQYKCPCRRKNECKCEFLKRFERKLAKGCKSSSINIYFHEDNFPGINVMYLLVEYLPNVHNLTLKNVDFYDLPIIFKLLHELPYLKNLTISSYKHSLYCYEDNVELPIVENLIIPTSVESFKFVFCGDLCDSHPIYIHPNIFVNSQHLTNLHLEHMAWPSKFDDTLKVLELTNLIGGKICFPIGLKKLTINHINRWTVAFCDDYNYKLPPNCRLILKFDASDKSCYELDSEPDSDPDSEDVDTYKRRQMLNVKPEFDPNCIKNRHNMTILKSFQDVVDTIHISSRIHFNVVPNIIKDCNNLKIMSIAIKGRPKENTWNAIVSHPSLKTLIVSISSKHFYTHLDNLVKILGDNGVKLYIVHKYSNPTVDEIKKHLGCNRVEIITGIASWRY
jgi:hypothetical protein